MIDHNLEEKMRGEYGEIIARANARVFRLQRENDDLARKNDELQAEALVGKHFKQLMDVVQENEVVRHAWDKFMATLRLAGYDERTDR